MIPNQYKDFQQELLNSLEHINLINDYHIDPNKKKQCPTQNNSTS